MAFFIVGEKFFSLDELNKAKLEYEKSNFVNMVMRDTKSLESMRKYARKRVEGARADLRYYTVRLCCTFGGKQYKKQGDNKRLTGTRKVDCKAIVRLLLSDDGQSLDVVESNLDHSNHIISKEVYLHLPMQRRLDKAHKMQAETLLSICGDTKLVQQHMQNVSGKVILLKDIANISHQMKKQAVPNNLKSVLQQLEATGDSVVDVLVSEDKFKGIFYQDVYMQSVFEAYPEMLLVGETFRLTGLQISAYLMLVIDGNGQSEVVSLLLLADESRSTVSAAVEAFQHHNPAWLKTQTIMTDNDFAERQVFASLFPDASLQLCLNHTIWTFRRDVTSEKMLISGSERDTCLAILKDMVYSADEAMYNRNMERLEAVGCIGVLDYVRSHWHDIRSQWVEGLKEQHMTLGETTLQRLESVGAKMKSVCCEIASLQQFFVEFRTFLSSLRAERTHRAMMMLTRKPTEAISEDLLPYRDCLTPYAFRMVHQQYADSLSLGTCSEVDENGDTFVFASATGTDTTRLGCCSCRIYTSRKLPCKHLLYVHRLREVEFDESVFDSRWKHVDYLNHCQLNLTNGGSIDLELLDTKSDEDTSPGSTGNQRSVEQAEKYRKARHMASQLASLCAKPEMTVFLSRLKVLQKLYNSWSKGAEVGLVKLEKVEDAPSSARKRARPTNFLGKTPRQPKQKCRRKGSAKMMPQKTKRKYHWSSVIEDDDERTSAALCDDVAEVDDDDDDEQPTASDDVDAMLLAAAADNDTHLSANDDDDEMSYANLDQSAYAEDDASEDLAAAEDITDIGDDVSYVIVPENSGLLTDVADGVDGSRLELRPLDAMTDIHMPSHIHMSSPPVRKRGRPPKVHHQQKFLVDRGVLKQQVTSPVGGNEACLVLQSNSSDV